MAMVCLRILELILEDELPETVNEAIMTCEFQRKKVELYSIESQ